jgi:predicted nucleotidyltransferase
MAGANFSAILPLLVAHDVRFIVIGGGAAIAHGGSRLTYDVDVVYARDTDNLVHLVAALKPYNPYPRGAGEVTGGGGYEQLLPFSDELAVFRVNCRFINLEMLIQLKKTAGRPRDLEAIAELEAILEERKKLAQDGK